MAAAVRCFPGLPTAAIGLRHGVDESSAKRRSFANLQQKTELTRPHVLLLVPPGKQGSSVHAGPVCVQSISTAHFQNSLLPRNRFNKTQKSASETGSPPKRQQNIVTRGAAGKPDASSNLARNLELEPSTRGPRSQAGNQFNGIFLLLILNIGIYVADHLLHVSCQTGAVHVHCPQLFLS